MDLERLVQEVRKAISDTLSWRGASEVSVDSIKPDLKIWEKLDLSSIAEAWEILEERLPQLDGVAESVKERYLGAAHTVQDLAAAVHQMLGGVGKKD